MKDTTLLFEQYDLNVLDYEWIASKVST